MNKVEVATIYSMLEYSIYKVWGLDLQVVFLYKNQFPYITDNERKMYHE